MTDCQVESLPEFAGNDLPVQLIPLVDEAATALTLLTATKIPVVGLTVTDFQFWDVDNDLSDQLNPSADEAAAIALEATATKTPVVGLTVTEVQNKL